MEALAGRYQAELLADAGALGARVYAEEPDAFGRRMENWLTAWRR